MSQIEAIGNSPRTKEHGSTSVNKIYIFLDVDETLLNSAWRHLDELNKLLQQHGEDKSGHLKISWQDFAKQGGSHKAFGSYDWYAQANAEMVADPAFNLGLPRVEEAYWAVQELAAVANLITYLTTRPDVIQTITMLDLLVNGFPQGEVICRPMAESINNTVAWKISVLENFLSSQQKELTENGDASGAKIIMIDDNVHLYTALQELNNDDIIPFLYAGLLTSHSDAQTWPSIVETIKTQVVSS